MYRFLFFCFLAFFCHALPADLAFKEIKMSDEGQKMLQLIEAVREGNEVDINAHDAQGRSLLMWAVGTYQKDVASMIIQKGADIHAAHGHIVLILAATRGYQDVVQLLLDAGVDVNYQDPVTGMALMNAAREGQIETIKILLAAGVDLNVQNQLGSTALMTAASMGYPDIVQLLLEAGADMTIKDNHGQDAIYRAENNGHLEVLRILLIHSGANMKDPKVVRRLEPISRAPSRPGDFFR